MTMPPPPPQWVLDINSKPLQSKPKSSIPDPPGFTTSSTVKKGGKQDTSKPARKPPTTEETDTLKLKKAWEVAIQPAKSLPMSAIGLYMTGNSLQIFPIFMVYNTLKTPFIAFARIQQTFHPFTTPGTQDQMLLVKITFVLCNLLGIALGLWKVNAMGLLPTTRSDWLAWESERTWAERAVPAPGLGIAGW